MTQQPLTLTNQDLFNKSKVHERSLAYYKKSQESPATGEDNTIDMVKTDQVEGTPKLHMLLPTNFNVDNFQQDSKKTYYRCNMSTQYEVNAPHMDPHSNTGTTGQCVFT